jgi:hypothetical protein
MNAIVLSETAILNRAIRPERGDLPRQAAEAILRFEFDPLDRQRMHELAVKNQAGELSDDEHEVLENYRQVGRLLDLMRSKARLSLRSGAGTSSEECSKP